MLLHATASLPLLAVGAVMYSTYWLQTASIVAMVGVATINGASYYHYKLTHATERALRRAAAEDGAKKGR